MRCLVSLLLFASLVSPSTIALAARPKKKPAEEALIPHAAEIGPYAAKLGETKAQKFRVGISLTAEGGPCQGIVATTPIPIDWPEQQVRILEEDVSPSVREFNDYRMVAGTVKQMMLSVPYLAPGEECHAILTLEIARNALLAPDDTAALKVPEKPDKQARGYLGVSPGIEVRNAKIRSLAKEITADKESGWEKAEAIYDWVREHIKYHKGDFKGAASALKEEQGDCEELSSLFIALCRATGIPARTVWIPEHCYPEFYLVDDKARGYWFPCQAAGSRDFGGILEFRPILQKGDNFEVPEKPNQKLRYVAEYLTGQGGKPKVKFIREMIGGPQTLPGT